jgi:hypothetical protein
MFSETFLVQIWKICSEVRIQGKKKFEKHVINFLTKGKIEILERGERVGGEKRIFLKFISRSRLRYASLTPKKV